METCYLGLLNYDLEKMEEENKVMMDQSQNSVKQKPEN